MQRSGESRRANLLSVRALLDEALLGLRAITDADVPTMEARSYVSAALLEVYEALAQASDWALVSQHSDTALQRSRDALSALSFHPSMDPAVIDELRLVAQAIGELSGGVLPPQGPVDLPSGKGSVIALPATVGQPMLLHPERSILFPTIPIPGIENARIETLPAPESTQTSAMERPPKVESAEDLQALVAWGERVSGPSLESPADEPGDREAEAPTPQPVEESDPDERAIEAIFGHAPPAAQVVWERGRGFFEDLAMMSLMRRPLGPALWSEYESVERRMLARVDAILACGSWIVPRLVQLLEDRPLPDPELFWASIFLLGSMAGDDSRDQIERLLRILPDASAPEEPELFDAAADALRFAAHPGIEETMVRWLDASDLNAQRLAIRVLGKRRATSVETLRPFLANAEPSLVSEAARALERIAAESVGGELQPHELQNALRADDEALFQAAVECAVGRGYRIGVEEARARLEAGAGSESAALMLAIGGDQDALQPLLVNAATQGSAAAYSALGWFGHVGAMPFLLGRLEAGDDASLLGLQRITGASLSAGSSELPEYAKGDLPFCREHFLAPEPVDELSADPTYWRAWWARFGQDVADPQIRYRHGHAYTTRDNMFELEDAVTTLDNRRLAHLELCARTGSTLPFDGDAFVPPQRAQLACWKEYLGTDHARAGRGRWALRWLR